MIARSGNFQSLPLNVVGSSTFGKFPKISIEKTINLFMSDNWLVPYSGYVVGVLSTFFGNGVSGRGLFASTKFDRLVVVISQNVYLVNISFNQINLTVESFSSVLIGSLETTEGVVYITENNKPQLLISDSVGLYLYDPAATPVFSKPAIDFTPGYITFHDTYFISAATNTNTWRLSGQNDGSTWPSQAANVGTLQTKPDNVQAVVRFPSRGNMIVVMGDTVTESWFDTGAQLFPYQRNNQFNIDYGCINPATVAYMDQLVVWLAQNEKSGPIIVYSNGGDITRITTDGIDYVLANLTNPYDSQAFLYRQDGHLFYHINFYTDNLSLYYDFNTQKFFHACDQNLNYFIASQVAFFNNQYYFISKNTGNLYVFDTIFTTYEDVDKKNVVKTYEIPRIRTCKNIRQPSQESFILNDVGFTIESGETDYQKQTAVLPDSIFLLSDGTAFLLSDGTNLLLEQSNIIYTTPAVDLSLSYDGGATFGNGFRYVLPGIGQRRNKLMWWQLGWGNDTVCQFKFWGLGRFVVTDGIANIRT